MNAMALLRVFGLLVLFTLIPMAAAAGAESIPSPSLAPATERPELEKLLASHELAESEIDGSVDEVIKAAGKKYTTTLEEGRAKAFRGKRVELAESLGRELTRFNEEA